MIKKKIVKEANRMLLVVKNMNRQVKKKYCPRTRVPTICSVKDIFTNQSLDRLCSETPVLIPTKGFLRLGTQVPQFGRRLNALDDFFMYNFDADL